MNTAHSASTATDERRCQARNWYMLRWRQSELPHADEEQWQKWSADPANLTEYRDFERLHSVLQTLPPPSLPSTAELLADSSGLELDELCVSEPRNDLTPSHERSVPSLGRIRLFIAAGAAAVMALVWIAPRIPSLSEVMAPQPRHYTTGPGDPRKFTLPDNSVATLSGSAELTVTFSSHRRYLVLNRGEALFEVRHDPAAPFEVDAGNGRISVLGTTFNVRRYSDQVVEVSVAKGAVAVLPQASEHRGNAASDELSESGAGLSGVKLEAGQEISYDAKGKVGRARLVSLEAVTGWLHGRRLYRGKPLAKVIEDVQLYLPQRVELDPALAAVAFSGSIDQLDPQQAELWVRGLPTIFPVVIDDSNPHRLLIRCRSHGCPELPPKPKR